MAVYYINLALIFLLAFPLCIIKPTKWKKAVYLAITFGWMWFLATFRYNIGFDYDSYIDIFDQLTQSGSIKTMLDKGFEPGFLLLTRFMTFFVQSSVVMYGIYSAIIFIPVAWFIYKYCDTAWLSTWLFVTLAFFPTELNFIRQGIACSISLLGYKFLREKKLLPYLLIVLLAASFHKTALILIPIYFLCHIKLNKKLAIFYASATLVAYMTSEFILDFVTRHIFSSYIGTIWLTEGFPLYFIIIPIGIFATCVAFYPFWKKRDPDSSMLLNLIMFSTIIWIFITRHFILERFSMYVYIFVLIALPSAISCFKASADDIKKLETMKAEASSKKSKPSKEAQAAITALSVKIEDGKKYYWSAVIAIMVVTLIYHEFGANVNNFHGIYPYTSIFSK